MAPVFCGDGGIVVCLSRGEHVGLLATKLSFYQNIATMVCMLEQERLRPIPMAQQLLPSRRLTLYLLR